MQRRPPSHKESRRTESLCCVATHMCRACAVLYVLYISRIISKRGKEGKGRCPVQERPLFRVQHWADFLGLGSEEGSNHVLSGRGITRSKGSEWRKYTRQQKCPAQLCCTCSYYVNNEASFCAASRKKQRSEGRETIFGTKRKALRAKVFTFPPFSSLFSGLSAFSPLS